jgi:CRP/FNR family cyclic AMP-dependent transcriptional regulator
MLDSRTMKGMFMRKAFYLMGILNDKDAEWLSRAGHIQRVEKGAELIHQGVRIDCLFIVLEGKFCVRLDERTNVALLGQGEIIGEISFLDSRPPTASVIAVENSYVLEFPREVVLAKLDEDIGFAARFYRGLGVMLADRLQSTTGRLGYVLPQARGVQPIEDKNDELDDTWTEQISFAASRFDRLLRTIGIAS